MPVPPSTSTSAAACAAPPLPLARPAADLDPSCAVVDSSALLQGQRTIAIAHNGTVYRLQATRQGKLILTK